MHVGGAAEWLLEPKTLAELAKAVSAARESGMPVRILGKGANLIVEDGTVPGVTIATDRLNLMWRPEAQLGGEALEALLSELGNGQMPRKRARMACVCWRCAVPRTNASSPQSKSSDGAAWKVWLACLDMWVAAWR
jgi:hypothetical protein